MGEVRELDAELSFKKYNFQEYVERREQAQPQAPRSRTGQPGSRNEMQAQLAGALSRLKFHA